MRKSKANVYKMKVDNCGRVVIPIDIRKSLGIDIFDNLIASCDGTSVKFCKENETELDIKVNSLRICARENTKITATEYDTLCEILDKLRS